jgi:hypothetical protein
MLSRGPGTATKTQLPRSIPTIDYSPPSGFEKYSSNQEAKTKVSQVFSPSNLAGKQLWYITAPASVPISAVKEVSLQNVQVGKPALSLNGREYGFVQGHADEKGCTKIMVPDGNSTGYHLGKIRLKSVTRPKADILTGRRAIDQTLHLQQIIQLPKLAQHASALDSGSQISDKATIPAKKPVRQQPEGLKMRFRPLGFGNGRTGNIGSGPSSSESTSSTDSDPEEPASVPPPAFRRPVGLDQSHRDAPNPSAGAKKTDPKHSLHDSDRSSETSDEDMGDAQVKAEEHKALQSSPRRSLKRKLSDVRAENSSTSPLKHPKTSSNILKTSKIPHSPAGLKELPSTEANSSRKLKNTSSELSPTLGSSVKTRPVHPPRASDVNITSSTALNPPNKTTPILPPSRPHFPSSSPLKGYQGANGEIGTTRSGKNGRSKVVPEESMVQSQALHNQASEPALREKGQKREKQRRRKEAKLLSQGEQEASGTNTAGEAPVQVSKSFSLSENITRSPTTIKPPPKSGLSKSSAEEKRLNTTPETKNGISSSKKNKSHTAKSAAPKDNGMATILPRGASSILPSPRKESVILPPKLK